MTAATLEPASFPAAMAVARRMREWDRRELLATHRDDDLEGLVRLTLGTAAMARVAWIADDPVAVIGCANFWPGCWFPWLFATDRFPEAALLLTRFARRVMIPWMAMQGARRLEVKTMEGHVDAQRWLARCFGARQEGVPHLHYGRQGETFLTYVRILNHVH